MKRWTPEEDATLTGLYQTLSVGEIARRMERSRPSIKNRVNVLGLKKPEGVTNPGCFVRGQRSWNKGLHYKAGGRSAETRFKPGHRGGVAADVYQPIGAERITKDGYCSRKVNDDMPLHKRWRAVHLLVWEAANGPVPKGHAITFINGDKLDCRLDNLACITRRALMQRNTVHNYPDDLRQVIHLKGVVTRKINTISKETA